jgi:hypothetical protein
MKKIIKRALKAGGIDLLTETSEKVIDSVLNGGVIEDVPLFGTIAKSLNIGKAIKDQLFEAKLERFLTVLSTIDPEEIEEFNQKMDSDPELHTKVGERVLLLLDRMDDLEKANWLARAFGYFMKGTVTFDKLSLIGRAIDRCALTGLETLIDFKSPTDKHVEYSQELASCGLVHIVGLPLIASADVGSTYRLTNFGEEFVELLL